MITREDIARIVDEELAGIRARYAERHAAELERVRAKARKVLDVE